MTDCALIRCAAMLGVMLVSVTLGAQAAEYFVNKQGNDATDGLGWATAFATVQRGLDALAPGDTLTIGPGEYSEAVSRKGLGSTDVETVIRAEIPGTVLLRGDVAAPEFKPVDGYRFVYEADFDGSVEAVAETDTLAMMDKRPNLDGLELRPGTCHYDSDKKKLYISTSDLRPPSKHHYTVLVTPQCGLYLKDPKRVVLDGMAATGFYRSGQLSLRFDRDYIWGIIFANPARCVIRNCSVFLNAGGISLFKGHGNVIENCVVYGNSNEYGSEGGGIIRFFGNDDVIRNCLVYNSTSAGIRYYLDMTGPAILRDNISWANAKGDYWIKGKGSKDFGLAERCVSGGVFNVYNVKNCLIGGPNSYRREIGNPPDCIERSSIRTPMGHHFADPDNFDFRLQSTSDLRGTGPGAADPGPYPYQGNIFYVSPDGDDRNDGTAVSLAWKTLEHAVERLKPGDTLYLSPGVHDGGLALTVKEVNIRGRGTEPVVIRGNLALRACEKVALERVTFTDGCVVENGTHIRFESCMFNGYEANGVDSLKAVHCVFSATPAFHGCQRLFLSGDIFAAGIELADSQILYSDYNSYSEAAVMKGMPDKHSRITEPAIKKDRGALSVENPHAFAGVGPNGTSIGVYRMFPDKQARLVGPFVHSVTDTTANIEWWTTQASTCEVAWGTSPQCENSVSCDVNCFGTFSLAGLKPNQKYYFKIRSVTPVKALDYHETQGLKPKDASATFTTLAAAPKPAVYYVAPDGDDGNDGRSRKTAWKSIRRAANRVDVGDTVLIAGGTYKETVWVRATGDKDRPITFKAMPGEKVVFDAGKRELANAFILNNKEHVVFDGFYFFGFNAAGNDSVQWVPSMAGVFQLNDSDDVTIRRCLMNGRGGGYCPPFVTASECERLALENCVVAGGFHGLHVFGCPDLRLRHNVFLRNLIAACIIGNKDEQKAYLTDNIFGDSLVRKVGVQLFEMPRAKALVDDNNCYYLRVSDEKRRMFLFFKNPEFGATTFDRKLSLAGYKAKVRPGSRSVVDDPEFKVVLEMKRKGKVRNENAYLGDLILSLRGLALDFDDLFATRPDIVKRGCGLQIEAFEDFHFNQSKH